jgi:hypothetical protein
LDLARERDLETNPFGELAQNYLHGLLMGDPARPSDVDPRFTALKEDLQEHGQKDPGIITRSGVLINGNTRRAALKELGEPNIRVGVLPPDAGLEDLDAIEFSLQLRKDYLRDYSFMNFLLAIDECAVGGQLPVNIQRLFRIKPKTYDQCRWILEFVRDSIRRSQVFGANNNQLSMRLVEFETHQGKLEELYRAYASLKVRSSDEAEALREQRLMALLLNKSKTDLRLIEPDFVRRYMRNHLPEPAAVPPLKIPGTSITAPGPSPEVQALRQLTTSVLQAKSVELAPGAAAPSVVAKANELLVKLDESLGKALDNAGRQVRLLKRRLAAVDRLSDACDDVDLSVEAVAMARSAGTFNVDDLDEVLITLKSSLSKLSAIVIRGSNSDAEGFEWLRAVGKINEQNS